MPPPKMSGARPSSSRVRSLSGHPHFAIFAQTCYVGQRTIPNRVTWIVPLLIVALTNPSRHAGAAGDLPNC